MPARVSSIEISVSDVSVFEYSGGFGYAVEHSSGASGDNALIRKNRAVGLNFGEKIKRGFRKFSLCVSFDGRENIPCVFIEFMYGVCI